MLRAAIPIAELAISLGLQRCSPSQACPQTHCARRDPKLCAIRRPIDGTVLRVGAFCPLFVDARGVAMETA